MSEEIIEQRFKKFSSLSRRQLGTFLVSTFSFVVGFSWNSFAQELFQRLVPPNAKNSASLLVILRLLYALIITLIGAVIIAYVNSRPNRPKDPIVDLSENVKEWKNKWITKHP